MKTKKRKKPPIHGDLFIRDKTPGNYPWACMGCSEVFTPVFINPMNKRGCGWWQRMCTNCQADNLLKMIFGGTEKAAESLPATL